MADGDSAFDPGETPLVEYLADQSYTCVPHQTVVLDRNDPGRLLPPVLQSIEPEVSKGDGVVMSPDAEQPAMMSNRWSVQRRCHALSAAGVLVGLADSVD